MDRMENEILKIPQLLRQGKKEEVKRIIEEYGLDALTLINLLADYRSLTTNGKRCCNCKYASRRKEIFVFCQILQRRKMMLSKCSLFSKKSQ